MATTALLFKIFRLCLVEAGWSGWRRESIDATSPPNFLREVGSLETLDPKRGYWIQALEDVTIAIAN